VLETIEKCGGNLLAVSPEIPDVASTTSQKNQLSYDVLSDVGNKVARLYRVAFDLPAELQEFYKTLGIDLAAHNGPSSDQLPLAATFLIDRNGLIRAACADADYVKRMEPDDIVAALRAIS